MRIYYTLTTRDPVIVSQSAATTNNHECLDYIPGSAILGAVAAQLYAKGSDVDNWRRFHNGQTRFSPCYPVVKDRLAFPTPASWHFQKGKKAVNGDRYDVDVITNHACVTFERDHEDYKSIQFKQCRDGYLNPDGGAASVKQSLTTKTALNPETGGAKEGQLFSYAYIEADQTFAGWIDCDSADEQDLRAALEGTLRIGRSRNTEFGRVTITFLPETAVLQPDRANGNGYLTVWCLSDCELLDNNGMPTLSPQADLIHPALRASLVAERTFVRGQKISRFNQKRKGFDGEQVLIGKGSVLVYAFDDSMTPTEISDAIHAIEQQGIGINRQQGLGWVYVNPDWSYQDVLQSERLFSSIDAPASISERVVDIDSPLICWVEEQLGQDHIQSAREETVKTSLGQICEGYLNARRYNHILISNEAGPSSTQWRRISERVRLAEGSWTEGVFDGEHAICKPGNDELGWGIQWQGTDKLLTFASLFKGISHPAGKAMDIATMRILLERLCRYDLSTWQGLKQMARVLDKELEDTTDE